MECIKMSYKGFEFSVNVKSINASFSKKISTYIIPKKSARTQEVCVEPAVISAKGCFLGKDADKNANMLLTVFGGNSASYLFSPIFPPMRMFFCDLKLNAGADKDCIEYSLTFVQEVNSKKRLRNFGYTYAEEGENLYDIAGRCRVKVEDLVQANQCSDLFSVKQGDKIWLS